MFLLWIVSSHENKPKMSNKHTQKYKEYIKINQSFALKEKFRCVIKAVWYFSRCAACAIWKVIKSSENVRNYKQMVQRNLSRPPDHRSFHSLPFKSRRPDSNKTANRFGRSRCPIIIPAAADCAPHFRNELLKWAGDWLTQSFPKLGNSPIKPRRKGTLGSWFKNQRRPRR